MNDAIDKLSPEKQELILDIGQFALDIIGIIEPTPFADLSNTVVSLFRKKWWDAGLTVVGVVPYLGDLAKLGKIPKYSKMIDRAVSLAKTDGAFAALLRPLFNKLKAALDRLPLNKIPDRYRASIEGLRRKIAEFLPASGKVYSRLDGLTDDVVKRVFGSVKNVGIIPRQNIRTAVEFFDKYNVGGKDPAQWAELLKGIDLHAAKPIEVVRFKPGELIGQYIERDRPAGRKIGQWMVKAQGAVSHRNLGLSGAGRNYKVYRVKEGVEVLKSKAATAADHWTMIGDKPDRIAKIDPNWGQLKSAEHVAGGGDQYFLPNAWDFLEEVLGK